MSEQLAENAEVLLAITGTIFTTGAVWILVAALFIFATARKPEGVRNSVGMVLIGLFIGTLGVMNLLVSYDASTLTV